jgi:hypothetical protein
LLAELFDAYWLLDAKPLFEQENNITKAFIDSMEKEKLETFLKFTPFPTKKRLFTFTSKNANSGGQIALIKGLGDTENQNTNTKTWDDELLPDVYISKAKFN